MTLSILDTTTTLEKVVPGLDIDMFPNWNAHPLFGTFTRNLYATIDKLTAQHQDISFAVMDGDATQLIASCTLSDQEVSFYGLPVVLSPRRDLGAKQLKKAITAALDHLCTQGRNVLVLGSACGDGVSEIDDACIGRLASPHTRIHAMMDLSEGEQGIHKHLRKSFRSLVNWGRTNLKMTYVNADNQDRALLETYGAFHTQIAGGHEYPTLYWDVFWKEIVSGRGELSLGYLDDGTLVAGTFTTIAHNTAYYTSGVYDRERFDKPLGHFPVFDAMVRAAERGATQFDLGEIVPVELAPSPKEAQIGFFKKGFAERCDLMMTWALSAD